ncbi:hypothetical protein R1flu_018217 [Riccia fluitans]|uniref:Uncharacterized protein n=1 Tax=Riccia fluitans TaxID=41844 RepID=A0ABD1ZJ45_9MARC
MGSSEQDAQILSDNKIDGVAIPDSQIEVLDIETDCSYEQLMQGGRAFTVGQLKNKRDLLRKQILKEKEKKEKLGEEPVGLFNRLINEAVERSFRAGLGREVKKSCILTLEDEMII